MNRLYINEFKSGQPTLSVATHNYGLGPPPPLSPRQYSNELAYLNLQRTINEPLNSSPQPGIVSPPVPQRPININPQPTNQRPMSPRLSRNQGNISPRSSRYQGTMSQRLSRDQGNMSSQQNRGERSGQRSMRNRGDLNVGRFGDFLEETMGASGDRYLPTGLGQPQSQADCPPGTRFYWGDGVTGFNICQDQ